MRIWKTSSLNWESYVRMVGDIYEHFMWYISATMQETTVKIVRGVIKRSIRVDWFKPTEIFVAIVLWVLKMTEDNERWLRYGSMIVNIWFYSEVKSESVWRYMCFSQKFLVYLKWFQLWREFFTVKLRAWHRTKHSTYIYSRLSDWNWFTALLLSVK